MAVLLVLFFFFLPKPSSFQKLPEPNGYDALTDAATRITRAKTSLEKTAPSELKELVVKNEASLRRIQNALTLPCAVPVRMSEEWIASHSKELMDLKTAAYAMDAEVYFLKQNRDPTNALMVCLDLMRFSQAIGRGGVFIDFMVGSACETLAVRRMTNLLSDLSAQQFKQGARVLEEIDSKRDGFAEISARELEWQRRTYSVLTRLQAGVKKHILRQAEPFSAFAPDPQEAYDSRTLEFRHLLLNMAARAFESDVGRQPNLASDLVPGYLRRIPRNPNTGSPLQLK